ncbi:MAG: hypothetical protein KF845_07200 [Cyclobacteriaceae bacterium]|nr:hypothetical protein [Cyclobacteriaceae bacterium]
MYSYILKNDSGAAPNPFWGKCTLTICKPAIRRTAEIGDWIIGTGSKNSKLKDGKIYDYSDSIIYAMKVTGIKTLLEYDEFCNMKLKNKIPDWRTKDWRKIMGDCIYDYSKGIDPMMRKGVHTEKNKKRDLSGQRALISNHFYYFGEEARVIPKELKGLIKKGQGHLKIESPELVGKFEKWIKKFVKNKVYADPQLRYKFDRTTVDEIILKCSTQDFKEDKNDDEEIVN